MSTPSSGKGNSGQSSTFEIAVDGIVVFEGPGEKTPSLPPSAKELLRRQAEREKLKKWAHLLPPPLGTGDENTYNSLFQDIVVEGGTADKTPRPPSPSLLRALEAEREKIKKWGHLMNPPLYLNEPGETPKAQDESAEPKSDKPDAPTDESPKS